MTEHSVESRGRLTSSGSCALVIRVGGLAASPLLLVFSPLVPLAVLIFVSIRRAAVGSSWRMLWWLSLAAAIVSCWPLMGLDIGVMAPTG